MHEPPRDGNHGSAGSAAASGHEPGAPGREGPSGDARAGGDHRAGDGRVRRPAGRGDRQPLGRVVADREHRPPRRDRARDGVDDELMEVPAARQGVHEAVHVDGPPLTGRQVRSRSVHGLRLFHAIQGSKGRARTRGARGPEGVSGGPCRPTNSPAGGAVPQRRLPVRRTPVAAPPPGPTLPPPKPLFGQRSTKVCQPHPGAGHLLRRSVLGTWQGNLRHRPQDSERYKVANCTRVQTLFCRSGRLARGKVISGHRPYGADDCATDDCPARTAGA